MKIHIYHYAQVMHTERSLLVQETKVKVRSYNNTVVQCTTLWYSGTSGCVHFGNCLEYVEVGIALLLNQKIF